MTKVLHHAFVMTLGDFCDLYDRGYYPLLELQRDRVEHALEELFIGPGPSPIAVIVNDDNMPVGIECSLPRLVLWLLPNQKPAWEPTPVFSDYKSRSL